MNPMLWPLGALLLLSLVILVERAVFWMRMSRAKDRVLLDHFLQLVEEGNLDEATRTAHGARDPVLKTLHYGLVYRNRSVAQAMAQQELEELTQMKKHLNVLGTIIVMAPLVGILGTVLGIVRAFQTLSGIGLTDSGLLISGISVALIPTVFGLIITVMTLFPYDYFKRKVKQAREEMQKHRMAMEITVQNRQRAQAPVFASSQPVPLLQAEDQSPENHGGLSEKEKRFFLS